MQLFVLRHGEAESHASSDSARRLTDTGRKDVAEVVTRNLAQLRNIEHIFVSPYIRAQETSLIVREILQREQGSAVETETSSLLTPDSDHRQVLTLLEPYSSANILIISHQPLVGTLVDWLGDLEPGRYRMGTSGLASISLEILAKGCGQLNWLHHPFD